MTDYIRDPNDLNSTTDDDLPGMWGHSDFEGGDPDERGYTQRWVEDYDAKFDRFDLADLRPMQELINRSVAAIAAYAWPVTVVAGLDPLEVPLWARQIDDDPRGAE